MAYRLMLLAFLATLALPGAASAQNPQEYFFEETASAFWSVPHTCADGTVVQGTFLVQSTRDFEAPDTADADPTVRLQFQAVCPDGTSYGWGNGACPATITSEPNLKSVHVTGTCTVRDTRGVTHLVTFDVTYTGSGGIQTSVEPNQGFCGASTTTRKQRTATATGTVTFDGATIVSGPANHPTRPAPFIRVDEERCTPTGP